MLFTLENSKCQTPSETSAERHAEPQSERHAERHAEQQCESHAERHAEPQCESHAEPQRWTASWTTLESQARTQCVSVEMQILFQWRNHQQNRMFIC